MDDKDKQQTISNTQQVVGTKFKEGQPVGNLEKDPTPDQQVDIGDIVEHSEQLEPKHLDIEVRDIVETVHDPAQPGEIIPQDEKTRMVNKINESRSKPPEQLIKTVKAQDPNSSSRGFFENILLDTKKKLKILKKAA